jgi:CheY-like chemotaxis protein
MREDRERALAAGCDGYIAKPINTRTLAQEIEQILFTIHVAVPGRAPNA